MPRSSTLTTLQSEKLSAHRAAAAAALRSGDADEAVAALSGALFLAPSDHALYAERGEAHALLCDAHSAVVNYRRALALAPPPSEDRAKVRATYGARLATLLDLRGLALIDAGEHAAAVPLYDEAITLKDDDRGLWLHRALARVGLGEHPAALRDLDECVARGGEGGDADARFLQAKLHLLCKDLHAARRAADLALSAEPGHDGATELRAAMEECAAVYSEEATKLVLLGSPAEAVANLTHAIELRPDDANLLVRRGAALRREGRLEEAAADLEAAISRGGAAAADGRRVLSQTLNDAGVRLALAERFAEAVPWFDKAVAADGAVGEFYLNRGDCYRSLKRLPESLVEYERAAELLSHDPAKQFAVRSRLAVVYNERGTKLFNHAEPRRAALEFARAIECNPKVSHFYANRAERTLRLQRFELARDDVLAALKLDPNNQAARSMLKQLTPH